MKEFYHVDRMGLTNWKPGDVIEVCPHHERIYGKMSSHGLNYVYRGDIHPLNDPQYSSVVRELIFELMRLKEFPEQKTRFQAMFAFESLEDAIQFGEGVNKVYRVKASEYAIYDLNLITSVPKPEDLSNQAHDLYCARQYWDGITDENSTREVLIFDQFEVLEQVY